MSDNTYTTTRERLQGVRFTIFSKDKDLSGDNCLSKRISLVNGEPKSDGSACRMGRGIGKTVEFDSLAAIAESISNMAGNSALALGVAKGRPPEATYRVASKEALRTGVAEIAIARTLDNFEFYEGQGLLLIDFDIKSAPAEVRAKIEAKGLDAVLAEICPEIAECARVVRESTSSGLSHNGHRYPASGGSHAYLVVADATDIERATKVLARRAWLRGYGWIAVSKAGSLLIRGPIDEAVASPERLIFEGAPIVVPPLVQSGRTARAQGEGVLDTRRVVLDLTPEEQREYEALVAEAKCGCEAEAARVAEAYDVERVAELVGRGVSEAKAREVVRRQREGRVLTPDAVIYFDDAGWVSVADVLKDPSKYDGRTCADPVEPYYHSGGGKPDNNCAVFYTRRGGGYVFSQAHGGIGYDLCHDYDSIEAMINNEVGEEQILEAMAQAELKKVTNIAQQARLKKSFGHSVGIETRRVDPLLNKMKKDIVGSKKDARKVQLYRDNEDICHYWLSIDGSERQPITVPEINNQIKLQNWFLARKHVPMDVMKQPEFEQWRNGLLEDVIIVENAPRILEAHAAIFETLTLYFSIHVPLLVRQKGEEYLQGRCGDNVRVNLHTRRLCFKWPKLVRWCLRIQLPERQIEELRLYLAKEGVYLNEKEGRGGWWRCTWGVRMDVVDEFILNQWLNPETKAEQEA
jgi:hypothetical protein